METIKKYLKEIIIGVLILSLLLVSKCSNDSQNVLQGERNVLKAQLSENVKAIEVFTKRQKVIVDSINIADKIKDEKISQLHVNNKSLSDKLLQSKQELQNKKDSFKNKSFGQLAEVFIQQGYKEVTASSVAVELKGTSPEAVLDDLAEGFHCFEDLQTLNTTVKNKNEEINIINEKVADRDIKLELNKKEIDMKNLSLNLSQDLNLKADSQIQSLKTNNFVNKLLVPISLIGGFLIGTQLKK